MSEQPHMPGGHKPYKWVPGHVGHPRLSFGRIFDIPTMIILGVAIALTLAVPMLIPAIWTVGGFLAIRRQWKVHSRPLPQIAPQSGFPMPSHVGPSLQQQVAADLDRRVAEFQRQRAGYEQTVPSAPPVRPSQPHDPSLAPEVPGDGMLPHRPEKSADLGPGL